MSQNAQGFSASWLALREPVDHRSVNPHVREALLRWIGKRAHIDVVDIGCGSGSHLRGLAPALPKSQHWRLVDYDAGLLDHAELAISAWAEEPAHAEQRLGVRHGDRKLVIEFVQHDLTKDIEVALASPAALVTSAAFFDLVAPAWIDEFTTVLSRRRLPLYAVLTYDGSEVWTPAHDADAAVLAAFHRHQGGDKGFGPAAGPAAASALRQALERHGYHVTTGDSVWTLDAADQSLIGELAKGIADAAKQTGDVDADLVERWQAARVVAAGCRIGHSDLFATPPDAP